MLKIDADKMANSADPDQATPMMSALRTYTFGPFMFRTLFIFVYPENRFNFFFLNIALSFKIWCHCEDAI